MPVLIVLFLVLAACHSRATHDALANGATLTLNETGAVVDSRVEPGSKPGPARKSPR